MLSLSALSPTRARNRGDTAAPSAQSASSAKRASTGNSDAQDRLKKKADDELDPAQQAGKDAWRTFRGDSRDQFCAWRDQARKEHANYPGIDTFETQAKRVWSDFDDAAHAVWESKRERIGSQKLDATQAVIEVNGSMGVVHKDLLVDEARVKHRLHTDWGSDGAQARRKEMKAAARTVFTTRRDGFIATQELNEEDAESYRGKAHELWTAYEERTRTVRGTIQQMLAEDEDCPDDELVAKVEELMTPMGADLSTQMDAMEKDFENVHIDVPFYSQLEGNADFAAGTMQCFKAAVSMAQRTELDSDQNPTTEEHMTVAGPNDRIQVGLSEDGKGQLSIDEIDTDEERSGAKKTAAQQGVEYIDGELEAGRPVVVGVSFMDNSYNADALTDHFVTINGRRGKGIGAIYTFLDPWARSNTADEDQSGVADAAEGELVVQANWKLATEQEHGAMLGSRYEVAMVRKNIVS